MFVLTYASEEDKRAQIITTDVEPDFDEFWNVLDADGTWTRRKFRLWFSVEPAQTLEWSHILPVEYWQDFDALRVTVTARPLVSRQELFDEALTLMALETIPPAPPQPPHYVRNKTNE